MAVEQRDHDGSKCVHQFTAAEGLTSPNYKIPLRAYVFYQPAAELYQAAEGRWWETEGNAIRASDFSLEKAILAEGFVCFLVFVHAKCCKWKREENGVWTVSVGCWAVILLRR